MAPYEIDEIQEMKEICEIHEIHRIREIHQTQESETSDWLMKQARRGVSTFRAVVQGKITQHHEWYKDAVFVNESEGDYEGIQPSRALIWESPYRGGGM